ncbi:MAG: hypothetical protein JST87_16635 [Bacteroidetes bacterium]|nr:hypothetical protein [Bacteroidota bacterium]MBS1935251.1 hypothetical protein [Bacteroidota bacterium]
MKHIQKNVLGFIVCLGIIIFSATSCVESHYYHRYHHHTRGWYEHRHMPPPPGVNFDIDIR